MHRTANRFITALFIIAATFALPSAASAQGGFRVLVRPPVQNVQKYAVYQQWIDSNRMLHVLANSVNQNFAIPAQGWMTAEECGEVNAFWRPADRTITLCYEMMDAIFNEFRYDGLSKEDFETAVTSATIFIAMHEVGHALVELLDLPVTGREEDVVDQFAAMALGRDNPAPALWAAEFWRTKGDFGDTGLLRVDRTPFDDEHSFDMQRFYNVLCWTYGKDPRTRGSLLRILPQSRATRCPSEYRRMASSWDRILAPHRRAAPVRLQPLTPPPAPRASFAGNWQISEQIGSQASGFFCESQIQITIQQSGQAFTAPYRQTGRCTVNGQQSDNPGQGQIQRGRIDGNQIFFQMETCSYAGALQEIASGMIVGSLECAVGQQDGTTATVKGVWQAVRR